MIGDELEAILFRNLQPRFVRAPPPGGGYAAHKVAARGVAPRTSKAPEADNILSHLPTARKA